MNLTLRPAVITDAPVIHFLIKELAYYERLPDHVVCSVDDLKASLFERHEANVILAEFDGTVIGFALYYFNYSTFLGRKGLYMEDLFVMEKFRRHGVGKSLFMKLIDIAVAENCGRMDFSVLDWNAPALAFYIRQGAKPLKDWTVYRIELQ